MRRQTDRQTQVDKWADNITITITTNHYYHYHHYHYHYHSLTLSLYHYHYHPQATTTITLYHCHYHYHYHHHYHYHPLPLSLSNSLPLPISLLLSITSTITITVSIACRLLSFRSLPSLRSTVLRRSLSQPSHGTKHDKEEEDVVVEKYRSVAQFLGTGGGEMTLYEDEIVTLIEKNQTGKSIRRTLTC